MGLDHVCEVPLVVLSPYLHLDLGVSVAQVLQVGGSVCLD